MIMNDLISRQAVLSLPRDVTRNLNGDIVEESVDVADIKSLPTIDAEPQWISCSKRLPRAEKKKYWICTNSGYQCQCRWTNVNHVWTDLTTDWHWHIMDIPQHTEVVAWMSLPKPCKEVDDENDRCRYMCDRQSL